MQTQVVWQAEQLHRDVQERKQEVDHLRVSSAASNAQRSVGDVDNDLDTVEADKAAEERAKDELLRRQGRLRCGQDGLCSLAQHICQSVGHQLASLSTAWLPVCRALACITCDGLDDTNVTCTPLCRASAWLECAGLDDKNVT